MNFIEIMIIILFSLFLSYLIFERIYHFKIRRKIKYVIHVNGIRGKSTVTRLIDAGLRECGYKVFSKTTGTKPTMINTDNVDISVKRRGNSNIREQLKMLRLAYKEGAEVLILECMAVNPELQKICEEKILNADITVITNVREDHILDMGSCLDDIAKAFSYTIPKNGNLIITDDDYVSYFKEISSNKNTNVIVVDHYENSEKLNTFGDNINLALGICDVLKLDKEVFFNGMRKYHQDFGAYEELKINDTLFVNGLSINDPCSIMVVYKELIKKFNSDFTILLNSRADRPTRTLQHINLMKDMNPKKIIISGGNIKYVKRKIEQLGLSIDVILLEDIEQLLSEDKIFAIGNIGGKGMEILNYFRCNGNKL